MNIRFKFSRFSTLVGVLGLVSASLSGCGGGGSSGGGGGPIPSGLPAPGTSPYTSSRQATAAACQPNPHQSGRARWTVLVYINAANNLQPDSLLNVGQMASVGSDGTNLNIVIQWKQANNCPYFSSVNNCGNPSFVGTHRYYILHHSAADVAAIENGNTSSLEDPQERLPDPSTNVNGTSDMGDWHVLANFIQWGATNYPSDHLAVVIWDHGSGALPVLNRSAGRKAVTRAVSQDANTGNQITTQQLAQALAASPRPIDDLIVDCSLQCTAEVAYQVRSVARVMVASEESPPGTGYPYDTWLQAIKNGGGTNPCDMGNILIQDTLSTYASPSYTDITQAMVDLSQMGNVAQAINAFGGSLLQHVNDQANLIYNARLNAQYFEFPEYRDLYDFADLIRTSPGVPTDLAQAAFNVENALYGPSGAILAFGHGSANEAKASGMSIYLPGPQDPSSVDDSVGYDPVYNGLALAQDAPNWPQFLQHQQK